MITKFGKRFLTEHISGIQSMSNREIAFGIDTGKAISTVSGNGTLVTFTTSSAHGLYAGDKVSIYGVTPTAYNLTNVSVNTVPTTTTFTVANTTTTSYVSGGSVIADTDTRLGFEFYRAPVSIGAPSIDATVTPNKYYIVYKTTIPQEIAATVNEVALYPGSKTVFSNFDSKFISDFEDTLIWSDSNGINPVSISSSSPENITPRLGTYMLKSTASSSSTKEYFAKLTSLNISGYSVNDSLTLAYYKADNNLQSIKIRFYSSDTAYYEATLVNNPSAGTGHKIVSTTLSDMLLNPVSSPDATNISKISIVVTAKSSGETNAYFDGLRINDEDTFDPSYGMIAKSIFSTSLSKTAGKQVDVEYKMEMTF